MLALYGLLAVVLAGVLFLAAAFLLPAGEQIAPPIRDEPLWELPAGKQLGADDVVAVRLPVALRGYRFAETDLLLDRLAEELRERDAEIARLRSLRGADAHAPEWAEEDEEFVPSSGVDLQKGAAPDGAVADADGAAEDGAGRHSGTAAPSRPVPGRHDASDDH